MSKLLVFILNCGGGGRKEVRSGQLREEESSFDSAVDAMTSVEEDATAKAEEEEASAV